MATTSTEPEDSASITEKLKSETYKLSERKNARSKVWELFRDIRDENEVLIPNYVACCQCLTVIPYKKVNTNRLLNHSCYKKRKLEESVTDIRVDSEDKKKATLAFTKWIAADSRPFSIVEGKGFEELVAFLIGIGDKYGRNVDVHHLIPHPTTISNNVTKLKEKHDAVIKDEIKKYGADGYGCTSDLWKERYSNESYLGVTMSYIKEEKLVCNTLAVISMDHERSTAEHIMEKMREICDTYDMDTFASDAIMVTDRGANMLKAFEEMDTLACICHLFNSALSNAIDQCNEMLELLDNARKLVKFVKKANLQHHMSPSLKSHVETRWYSNTEMLQSIEPNLVTLSSVLAARKRLDLLENIRQPILKQVVTFLVEIKRWSSLLETSNAPTIHLVIPCVTRLRRLCEADNADFSIVGDMKSAISAQISSTIEPNITMIHKVGVFLFPPANQLTTFDREEKTEIYKYVKTKMVRIKALLPRETSQSAMEVDTDPVEETPGTSILFKEFCTPAYQDSISLELSKYKAEKHPPSDMSFDVLEYWRTRQGQYPLLYKLSRKIFATPASSTDSERIFSRARFLINTYRTQLSPGNINDLLTISSNFEKISWDLIEDCEDSCDM
jgi:Hermes transposase DNA-binding domain/hAT family C-terminal dimerisation region